MKFLYFGDKHERVTTPKSRFDDFRSTQRKKTEEILRLGRLHEVQAFLQPGDFFDSPQPPLDFVAEVVEQWTEVPMQNLLFEYLQGKKDEFEIFSSMASRIPIIGVAGNHELFGNNLKTLPKTMIGFLNKVGFIQFATKANPVLFETEDGLTVAITGTHYHVNMDHPDFVEDDYVVHEKLGDVHIHIVHGYLTNKDLCSLIPHVRVDQIAHTKADLTITGHDHIGFPLTEIGGKFFVNPGAVVRLSNHPKELERIPKVLLIDVSKKGVQIEEIPLASAAKGEEVLSRESVMSQQERIFLLQQYKETVEQSDWKTEGTDIVSAIRSIPEEDERWKQAKEALLSQIAKKEEELSGFGKEVKDAYIEKIEIENFQSHEHSVIECSQGLNVFVGESKQGKTAVLRALSWLYENKPAGKRIVRQGASYAKVTVWLSNGYKVARVLETKRGGRNGYEVTTPTGECSFYNTKSLEVIQPLLGFSVVPVDKDVVLNVNFLKQGKGWFLIGDEYSAPLRAKIVGTICGVQYADAVLRELEAEERKYREREKWLKKELEELNEQTRRYEHVAQLEDALKECERMWNQIEMRQERKTDLEQLWSRHEAAKQGKEELLYMLNRLSRVDAMKGTQQAVRDVVQRWTEVRRWQERLETTQRKLAALEQMIHRLPSRDGLEETWSMIKQQSDRLFSLLLLWDKAEKLKQQKAEQEERLRRLKDLSFQKVEELKGQLIRLDGVKETYQKTQELLEKKLSLQQKIKSLQGELMKQEEQIKHHKEQYGKWLKAYGKCPICHSVLHDDRIHQMVDDLFAIE
ncbi:AAA family ATPase [Geobacillus subterraneus]|uniref:Nuclease SbcCD subunit C n=1 Tax=Geobacillus subterraneus TaxID=129338 RepID=A0A679G1H3_9BACL|nr:AAA family ATPase [Geobacillus subterraneus]BBW98944.1 hypothetical protein GsuE55_37770 [Geobacillus subterraneus]